MPKALTKTEKQELRRNEEKWTPTLMAAGWTVIPSVILDRQRALGLDAVDVNIIMHLLRHWWYPNKPPFPTKRTIATCMGIHESTVRRRIAAMEKDGLIQRKPSFDPKYGQRGNEYHFDGLIQAVKPYAEEWLRDREGRRREDSERSSRKRLKLSLIKTEPDEND